MKMSDYLKTWDGALAENRWNRMINTALAASIVVLTYVNFSKDQIVVIQPQTLGSEAWISTEAASRSYKESWGLYLAQLTGNVTPTSVGFLKDRLKPLLSPKIYGEVIDALEQQAQSIRDDRISIRFEPRTVEYEPSSNKVFVYGYSFTKGSSNREKQDDRTYEYKIEIANYAPLITDISTYAGKPRTQKELNRLNDIERRRSDKNAQ